MSKEILLPQRVDAFRFAENEIRLEGVIPIVDMERLASSLSSDAGQVHVRVQFGKDEQGAPFLRGEYSAHLLLRCQRCMEAFDHEVNGQLLVGIVTSEEEMDRLPKGYDGVIVEDGQLQLRDVIEDDLIVGLPIVPMHSMPDCNVSLPLEIGSGSKPEPEKENPFKVIELLRSKRDINK